MSIHFKCALTHVVFGVLLIAIGIVDVRLNYGKIWSGPSGFFVIFCGVWVGKLSHFVL